MRNQNQLDERTKEIQGMSDKQLVWALQAEAGWEELARRNMRIELANNTYADMELLKHEILRRMSHREEADLKHSEEVNKK